MKFARPAFIPAVAAVAAAVLAIAATVAWRGDSVPEPAPAVSYTLLDGERGSIEALRGKVVLVNFWATSCATCVAEMPEIAATHGRFHARGFDTLAVAMRHDAPARVAHFVQTRQLPFGVAIDNTGDIARQFGDVQLTPTTFLIDKRGRIVKRYVGTPDFAAMHLLIDALLAQT